MGCGVPVGFFTGFSFIPPLGKTAAWAVAVGPFSQTRGLSSALSSQLSNFLALIAGHRRSLSPAPSPRLSLTYIMTLAPRKKEKEHTHPAKSKPQLNTHLQLHPHPSPQHSARDPLWNVLAISFLFLSLFLSLK